MTHSRSAPVSTAGRTAWRRRLSFLPLASFLAPASCLAASPTGAEPTPTPSPSAAAPTPRALGTSPAGACTRTPSIDAKGATDVTAALQQFVEASPAGSVICLAADGKYRMDGQLHLAGRTGITIDGRGATLFASVTSPSPRLLIDHGGSDIRIRNLTIEGLWPKAGTQDAHDTAFEGNHGIAIGGAHDVEIGPAVVIRNVAGDGVYVTGGTVGATARWADHVSIHDSVIELTGRMGVAITDGGRDVVVEYNEFREIALYAFDLEPNGVELAGAPAGADRV